MTHTQQTSWGQLHEALSQVNIPLLICNLPFSENSICMKARPSLQDSDDIRVCGGSFNTVLCFDLVTTFWYAHTITVFYDLKIYGKKVALVSIHFCRLSFINCACTKLLHVYICTERMNLTSHVIHWQRQYLKLELITMLCSKSNLCTWLCCCWNGRRVCGVAWCWDLCSLIRFNAAQTAKNIACELCKNGLWDWPFCVIPVTV